MAARFETTFYNNLGKLYTVHIHDTDYASAAIQYTAAGEGFELSQDGDDMQLYTPIIATSVMVYMQVEEKNRTAIENFLFDIVDDQDENRFTVVIYEDGTLFFRGKVQVERISVPDRRFTTITINATDGFGRLRSIPYYDGGTLYEGWETVHNHLFNILDKLNLFGYGGSVPSSMVVATKLRVATETSRIFENVQFQHDAVKEIASDGTILPLTCYDVLLMILTRFGCRIVQLYGEFHIQEFTALAETTAISAYLYDSSGVYVSTNSVTYNTDTIEKLAGGQSRFREPAKSVQLDYVYQDSLNGSNLATGVIPYHTWFNAGYVPSGNGEQVAVNFDFSVIHTAAALPTAVLYFITYHFSIRRGTSFLTNESGTPVWQSDSSKTYSVTNMYEIDDPIDIALLHQVSFIIPELPSSGDLYIYWDWSKTLSNGGTLPTAPNGTDSITNLGNILALLYSENLEPNEGTISTIASGTSVSGEQIELDPVVVGDLPFLRSIGRLQYYVFPSLWYNSENDWGHDGFETLTLSQLVTREILSLQRKTTKLISYVIRSNYPGAGYKIQNNVVTRASYQANSATWNIEAFVPVIDRSGITWSTYVESDQVGGLPGGITVPPPTTTNYWKRDTTTLSPATTGDKVEVAVSGADTALKGVASGTGNAIEGSSVSTYGVYGLSVSGRGVYGSSTTGTGVYALSASGYAIYATSSSGSGIYAQSISGAGGYFYSGNSVGLIALSNPSSSDIIHNVLSINRSTTGTAANGIGAGIGYSIENSAGNLVDAMDVSSIFTNAVNALLTSAFVIRLRNAGAALAEVMRLTGLGELITNKLSLGTSSAPTSTIQVNGSHTNSIIVQTGATLNVNDSMYVIICNTTSNAITINLPTAVGITGRTYVIRRYGGGNNVVIDPFSTQTLLGSLSSYSTLTLANNGEWVEIMSDGADWYIVKDNPTF